MGRTIGVIAIKGGVGKTTVVANLGAVLAHEFNQRVLILDANFSAANLGLHFGIVNPEITLHDVLAEKHDIKKAVISHGRMDIIAGSLVPKKVDPLKLRSKLNQLKKEYDFILIDSSPALNEEILATMVAADELMVVTTPDYPTLSCTMHAVKVAKRRGTPITGIIVNKKRNQLFELTTEEIEEATETPVIAVVRDDVRVLEALAATTPATIYGNVTDVVVEYRKLGAALLGETYRDPRFLNRMRDALFKTDTAKHEVNRAVLGSPLAKK